MVGLQINRGIIQLFLCRVLLLEESLDVHTNQIQIYQFNIELET